MIYLKIDDVAKGLGISPSTIKKYYLLVEQHGYRFKRSQQGQLMFTEQDVQLFRKIIQVKNEPGITLIRAVEQVMSSITDMTVMTDDDMTFMTDTTAITEIKELILKQNELIQNQQHQINLLIKDQQENKKLLEGGISKREEILTQSLRETLEVKKMLAQITATYEEEKRKNWWQKLFS